MKASFSVHVESPRDLVRIVMAGFFEPADIVRFQQERDRAHAMLTCPANQHLTLVDIRDMNIQSQGSVAMFADLLTQRETLSRRIAFVVGRSLARSQIVRAAAGRGQLFFDAEQAEAWLIDDSASGSRAA